MSIILASSSPFRKELLAKLGLKFSVYHPNIDESKKNKELPKDLVYRLAQEKAYEVAKHKSGLIIASDQIMVLENKIINKPNNHNNAVEQLQFSSGKTATFFTSLALLNTINRNIQTNISEFSVTFRKLTSIKINNYLKREKPYNCAGSFKSEGLGISLVKNLKGDDPNALIGLPLIKLITMLENEGVDIL
jgi:MAF protein